MDYKQLLVQFTEDSTYIQAHLNKVPKTPVHLKVEVADQGIYVARRKDNEHLDWKVTKKPDAHLVIYSSEEEDDDTTILMTKD